MGIVCLCNFMYVCVFFVMFIWKQMIYTAPFKFDETVNLTSKQNID